MKLSIALGLILMAGGGMGISHAETIPPGLPDDTVMNAKCSTIVRLPASRRNAEKNARVALQERKFTEAFCWTKVASDLGGMNAREQVGQFYVTGGDGVQQNVQYGLRYLRNAAEFGYQPSTLLLVEMYSGYGIKLKRKIDYVVVDDKDKPQERSWCSVLTSTSKGRRLLARQNRNYGLPACSEKELSD